MHRIIRKWGWEWESPWEFTRPEQYPLPVPPDAVGWWKGELKAAACGEQWAKLHKRGRDDMKGTRAFDLQAAQALHLNKVPRDKKLNAHDHKILERVLTGAFRPLSRLHKAKVSDTPHCQWCETGEEETKEHLFWICPAWTHVRKPYLLALEAMGFRTGTTHGQPREGNRALWWLVVRAASRG